MIALVVRFDQELDLLHVATSLRCPRGVRVGRPAVTGRPEIGTVWTVAPCQLDIAHDGDCEPGQQAPRQFTRCGLAMHDAPWAPIQPGDAAHCPACFDLPADEQGALL